MAMNIIKAHPSTNGALHAIFRFARTEKRTFKEKLHEAILQAEDAELEALREAQKQDKKTLAISLLVEGKPRAYVDFFQLTHPAGGRRGGGRLPGVSSAEAAEASGDLPPQSLVLLKDQLVRANAALDEGNVQDVCEAYKQLAKYFAQMGRLRTAEFFFQKCLHLSKEAGWLPGELEANLALGIVYEELGEVAIAIACHERRLELAAESGAMEIAANACQSLTTVYLRQAEELNAAKDVDAALEAYNKCLNAAERADNPSVLSKAHYQMGMLYHQHGKWTDAMFYLRRYIELSNSGLAPNTDKSAEGAAHTTYANCLQEAQFQQSVTYFQRFFELARGLSDNAMLEAARFNLGVARGAVLMEPFMNVVNSDLPKLIAWKNNRTPFVQQQR
ncbi:subunit of axonemal inner dynein [Dunaliella salina]|uniref:Tetratricopeptide repeat protein 29 n=1 Tax=Dunaliella salina TaxID=3046 RepID=A0ABQ7GNK9_DUNSA|nr:subunit of axonemal inner dynein [Dunaliella salina]|eukprot:KAF5836200.1 subunit of axonemal inner dynein [Dunaliella salina]